MGFLSTRAGGDSSDDRRKTPGSAVPAAAGAPALKPYRAVSAALLAGADDASRVEPPEWIELLPVGEFHGRDGRGPFRLEDPENVIAATAALRMEAGLPIDYDHATDLAAPSGRPAPAAGWIRELQVRDGALWGRVEWTERARIAIRAREYRYISPVFQYAANDGRVIRLLRAGLTNNPNLYLTAISAAGDEEGAMEEFSTELKRALEMPEEATAEEVVGEVARLRAAASAGENEAAVNAGAPDPARYVAVADFQRALSEINALKAERTRERAAIEVEAAIHAGKLTPAQREWALRYCAADFEGFAAFAARQPSIIGGGASSDHAGPLAAGHRSAGRELSDIEVAVCASLGLSPEDYLKRKSGRADFLRLGRAVGGNQAR